MREREIKGGLQRALHVRRCSPGCVDNIVFGACPFLLYVEMPACDLVFWLSLASLWWLQLAKSLQGGKLRLTDKEGTDKPLGACRRQTVPSRVPVCVRTVHAGSPIALADCGCV